MNLKIAFLTIARNKVFSLINIAGLALGIAVFLLMMEFVASEWGTNRFHEHFNDLYRLASVDKQGPGYYIPPGYGPAIEKNFPAVQSAVRVADGIGSGVISTTETTGENKAFREPTMLYVDGSFFETFSFPLVSGRPSLKTPATLALTETMAKKLFGASDVAGKTVKVSNQFGNTTYTVAAVVKDMPEGSDIRSEVFLSLHTLENPAFREGNEWADPNTLQNGFVNIYVRLKPGQDAATVEKGLTAFSRKNNPEAKEDNVILQPFKYLHLAPGFNYPYQTFGSYPLVMLLFSVSLLILFIAWVNYINLSTVQSLTRARESGVRKVLGASRPQLMRMFMAETLLVTVMSVSLALLLTELVQPLFNQLTGKALSLSILFQGWFWGIAAVVMLLGTMLAGGYVSLVLSAHKPADTLRGRSKSSAGGVGLRKGLVVFQFATSIIFIVATIVLFRQMTFMKRSDLGMKLDQLLVIKGPTVSSDHQGDINEAFRNQLAALPFVKKLTSTNNVPGLGYNFSTEHITRQTPSIGDDKKNYSMFICDSKFFDTYGIGFTQGGAFSKDDADRGWSNSNRVVLNEKAAKQLGFDPRENIVGKKIVWMKEYEIMGVVKDYHHLSKHQPIDPVIYLPSASFVFFTVQTERAGMADKIDAIGKLYKASFPGNPYEYFFADENYELQYQSEQKLGSIFIAAALLAIFIACLGLFGLAAFTARQRVKEIGIRKVLGAGIGDITSLLSRDFLKLVGIALLIATPVAWWAMRRWLQDFAYRIDIKPWYFIAAGGIAILIAGATVSLLALRAALANPTKSLRSE
jgi:putative ABC transport system permease protein